MLIYSTDKNKSEILNRLYELLIDALIETKEDKGAIYYERTTKDDSSIPKM